MGRLRLEEAQLPTVRGPAKRRPLGLGITAGVETEAPGGRPEQGLDASPATCESLRPGMMGATLTPTSMPAASRRRVRTRRRGVATCGSKARACFGSQNGTLMVTPSAVTCARLLSTSTSGSMRGALVMMCTGLRYPAPCRSCTASSRSSCSRVKRWSGLRTGSRRTNEERILNESPVSAAGGAVGWDKDEGADQ